MVKKVKEETWKYFVLWPDLENEWSGRRYETEAEALQEAKEFLLDHGDSDSIYCVVKVTHLVKMEPVVEGVK